jgi:uncharacterized protein YbjQ (UPF0145 family)
VILVTTDQVPGQSIIECLGICIGEGVVGANVVRDAWASLTDTFGGRSGSYEAVMRQAKTAALNELAAAAERMGANAVVGVQVQVSNSGKGTVFLCSATGTAVVVED